MVGLNLVVVGNYCASFADFEQTVALVAKVFVAVVVAVVVVVAVGDAVRIGH